MVDDVKSYNKIGVLVIISAEKCVQSTYIMFSVDCVTLCYTVWRVILECTNNMAVALWAWLFALFVNPADTAPRKVHSTATYKTFYIEQSVSINVVLSLFW